MTAPQAPAGQWQPLVDEFFASAAGVALQSFLAQRKAAGAAILPPDPFRALRLTNPGDVRVVILGQDPYHGVGQANGLAFAVAPNVRIPPSLRNIYKELSREYGRPAPATGDLSSWAAQGVLLLNAVLTVEEGQAGAHARRGWEILTDRILAAAARESAPHAFLLWGGWAQKKRPLIEGQAAGPQLILQSNHPSPLSALRPPEPFTGCGHFQRVNDWLTAQGVVPVDWFSPQSDTLF